MFYQYVVHTLCFRCDVLNRKSILWYLLICALYIDEIHVYKWNSFRISNITYTKTIQPFEKQFFKNYDNKSTQYLCKCKKIYVLHVVINIRVCGLFIKQLTHKKASLLVCPDLWIFVTLRLHSTIFHYVLKAYMFPPLMKGEETWSSDLGRKTC